MGDPAAEGAVSVPALGLVRVEGSRRRSQSRGAPMAAGMLKCVNWRVSFYVQTLGMWAQEGRGAVQAAQAVGSRSSSVNVFVVQ